MMGLFDFWRKSGGDADADTVAAQSPSASVAPPSNASGNDDMQSMTKNDRVSYHSGAVPTVVSAKTSSDPSVSGDSSAFQEPLVEGLKDHDGMSQAQDEASASNEGRPSPEINYTEKAIDLLDYVAAHEESERLDKTFCQDYTDEKDWTDNHFLQNKKPSKKNTKTVSMDKLKTSVEEDGNTFTESPTEAVPDRDTTLNGVVGIHLTNYEVSKMIQKQLELDGPEESKILSLHQDDSSWIKMARQEPRVPTDLEGVGDKIRSFLEQVQEFYMGQGKIQPGDPLKDVLPLLSTKDLPCEAKDPTGMIRDYVLTAAWHSLYTQTKDRQKILFNLAFDKNYERAEILVGMCQVRSRCKKDKIINGPLFEIAVVPEVRTDSIILKPARGAKPRINNEVLNALGVNEKTRRRLNHLAAETDVSKIELGNPETYSGLVNESKNLNYAVRINKSNDEGAHRIPEDSAVVNVTTDAWCLYVRKPTSTPVSRDCRIIADRLRDGKLPLTGPAINFMIDPDQQVERRKAETLSSTETSKNQNLRFPLSATPRQIHVGHRVLVEKDPVVVVRGPPGVGKTQTNVNVAAAFLAMEKEDGGGNLVFTSASLQACEAFLDKLPPGLRILCVALPLIDADGMLSDEDEDTWRRLYDSLKKLIDSMSEAREDPSKHTQRAKRIESEVARKKATLLDIDAKFEGAFNDHGEILKEASTSFLETALKSGKIYSGIVQAILNVEQREIDSVLQAKQHKGSDDVSFGVFNNDKIDKYIEHAQSKQKGEFSFAVGDVKDFEENIKVGGQKPTLNHHWDPVVRELEARKQRGDYHREHLEVFAKFGCREEDICNPDGTFTSQFYSQLENARGLKEQFTSQKGSVQRQVKRFLKEFSNPRALQHKRAELVEEIQDLEGKLVSELVLAKLGRDVSENQLGYLNQFLQVIGEAKNSAMKVGSNQSLKANTELDDIKTKFREAAKFMPFLVATHDQYFEMVDPTDRTGMVILDEASQSKFTVLNLLFRCNQLMIVGDDQQVSPKVVKREWMDQLKHLAPSIFCRSQLKHGSSFFDACVSAFPRHIFLNEHYRCEPRIANIFNALFYGGDLEPMRLPSSSKVLVSRYVDCGKKPKKEEATTRCMDVASRIVRQIVTSTKSESKIVPTIGIISIGDRSNEAMKKAVADVKNDLRTEFGKDLVEAHNITFGEASRFQGGERDIIVLVDYDKGKKMNDPNSKKIWNVSLSRAKNQLYLVHSYRWDDLKWDDNRKAVLRFFDGTDDSFAKATTVSPLERAPSMRDELHRLYVLAELHLVEAMIENGFLVTRNDDMKRWSHALRISTHGDSGGALVCIENKGETFDNWQATKEQQLSLEKAGRHCLRVPLLSLVLDFRTTAVHVLDFLKSAGLSVSATKLAQNDATSTKKRSITEIQNADTAKQSKTIEEEKKLKEPTSSSVKRGPSEQHVAPPCKRSKGDESDSDSDDLFLHEQTAVAKDTTSNNDSKVRGRVYFKSLHHQAHKKDLKTELRCRGVQFVASKINFGNLKKLLQDNEKNTGSFLPRSDAKFEPKKCGN